MPRQLPPPLGQSVTEAEVAARHAFNVLTNLRLGDRNVEPSDLTAAVKNLRAWTGRVERALAKEKAAVAAQYWERRRLRDYRHTAECKASRLATMPTPDLLGPCVCRPDASRGGA